MSDILIVLCLITSRLHGLHGKASEASIIQVAFESETVVLNCPTNDTFLVKRSDEGSMVGEVWAKSQPYVISGVRAMEHSGAYKCNPSQTEVILFVLENNKNETLMTYSLNSLDDGCPELVNVTENDFNCSLSGELMPSQTVICKHVLSKYVVYVTNSNVTKTDSPNSPRSRRITNVTCFFNFQKWLFRPTNEPGLETEYNVAEILDTCEVTQPEWFLDMQDDRDMTTTTEPSLHYSQLLYVLVILIIAVLVVSSTGIFIRRRISNETKHEIQKFRVAIESQSDLLSVTTRTTDPTTHDDERHDHHNESHSNHHLSVPNVGFCNIDKTQDPLPVASTPLYSVVDVNRKKSRQKVTRPLTYDVIAECIEEDVMSGFSCSTEPGYFDIPPTEVKSDQPNLDNHSFVA